MSHTPGPWLNGGPIGAGIYVVSDARPIAIVYGPNREEMPIANANLIAAAPDLLEAAKLLDEYAWSVVYPDCREAGEYLQSMIDKLRAAIKKAEGQEFASAKAVPPALSAETKDKEKMTI